MTPSVTAHEFEWRDQEVLQPIGGPVPRRTWSVRTLAGDITAEGGDSVGYGSGRTPVEYFLAVFPQQQLSMSAELTSAKLSRRGRSLTTPGEVLKLFAVVLLGTRFEFGCRSDLWSTTPRTKHIPAPAFGLRNGMSRNGFDNLWRSLTFSGQRAGGPPTGANGSEQFRWSLVNDFVEAINRHRAPHVTPAETLCVDESISQWYGQGGEWISVGLPMYVAIDRKPENRYEIQNVACGRSGIMLCLKIVTTAADQAANISATERGLLHGTAVLQQLVAPWMGSGRIVCADSYFASVEAAEALRSSGLSFIGVVKTTVHADATGTADMMATIWVDRSLRYLIATAGSSRAGTPCERLHWWETHGGAQRMAVTVSQPEVAEIYYNCAGRIDQHNRCRQDDLRL